MSTTLTGYNGRLTNAITALLAAGPPVDGHTN